jgi:trehalose 6-phosphate synthase
MNLVAKEFVAAQDPENPGVLILSKFTGAAAQLKEALTINPFSADELAEAIEQALKMPVAERKRRWRSLYDIVNREDAAWWCDSFLQRLRGSSEIERPVLLSQAA